MKGKILQIISTPLTCYKLLLTLLNSLTHQRGGGARQTKSPLGCTFRIQFHLCLLVKSAIMVIIPPYTLGGMRQRGRGLVNHLHMPGLRKKSTTLHTHGCLKSQLRGLLFFFRFTTCLRGAIIRILT